MYRFAMDYLAAWKSKPGRKPLIIRGARQVGKSWLARQFASEHFDNLVEINFERHPDLASVFAGNDPVKTVKSLELRFDTSISPGKTLIFLDEIQAAPAVFASLRYFFEEMPDLHIVAAGSLLEFAFDRQDFSVPVGRLEYLYLGPMQFEEFLYATGHERLSKYLAEFHITDHVAFAVHNQLIDLFRTFLIVGGMPAAINAFVDGSFRNAEQVKHSILLTFQDDFGKYARTVRHDRLQKVYASIPSMVGTRFKYVKVDSSERSKDVAAALDLLCRARIAWRVCHSSANGIPVGSETNELNFKVLFLDVGLMNSSLGLGAVDFEKVSDVMLVNSGAICEQVVGQHLLYSQPSYQEPDLHFWSRERASSAAEIDYVISEGISIVPIEVKAGKTGTLKSMHMFLREKNRSFGVRLNSDLPSLLPAETAIADGNNVPFTLLSLPLYLVGQTRRLARESFA